jgi:hypothetical protein
VGNSTIDHGRPSPEDPRQDGGTPTEPLESAEAHLRRSGGAISPESRAAAIREQSLQLVEWARECGRLSGPGETGFGEFAASSDRSDSTDGQEHRIRHDLVADRILKVTYGRQFGIAFPIVGGFPQPSPGTPLEYLARWRLSNELFGDDARLERVLVFDTTEVALVVSQPIYQGRELTDSPEDRAKLAGFMSSLGFEPFESVGGEAMTNEWFREFDTIAVYDCHPGNFIEAPSGLIVPIDLHPVRLGS